MHRKHALIIGGTGMLQNVSHWLVAQNYFLSVINRNTRNFEAMKASSPAPDQLYSIRVDYHNYRALEAGVKKAFSIHGAPELIISWIHSSAPYALPTIIRERANDSLPWKLFHVQGSSSYFVKERLTVPENCTYRRVYLGFIVENEQSRWLTHDEISEGVMKAIRTDASETIVGTLQPWNKRP
ncbi:MULTISPECIES: short-chain dehydrogenase [unclassified Virgibacillus]|uniref:short-chain dehydrogenase n=1 Tax=unclassified Virgibacillus TaxID=2620237 RepID=UPI0024DE401C|nr:short-chain dehydrogenase [Virgibacillus sp. LDC-1]